MVSNPSLANVISSSAQENYDDFFLFFRQWSYYMALLGLELNI